MKKLLLLLILILFLTFTLIGNCWVAGYDQRIKLTTDHTKIDAALSDFPVTAFFTGAQAEEIFAEFDADEDFDRGQFALGDDTLLKAEKELFDDSASLGIYHFKVPSVSDSAGTDIYFYYDNDADHNTSYIGLIGSATATEVWVDYLMVCHMVDETISTLLDSTSNDYDLTKKDDNQPQHEVTQQHFDGTDDYIAQATLLDTIPANGAISVYFKPDDASEAESKDLIVKINDETADHWDYVTIRWLASAAGGSRFIYTEKRLDGALIDLTSTTEISNASYYLATITWGSDGFKLYIDDTLEDSDADTNDWGDGATRDFWIGANNWEGGNVLPWDGIIREVRVSQTQRNIAWIKGTYNSLWDTLLTYGDEETPPVGIIWNTKTITKWNTITITKFNTK